MTKFETMDSMNKNFEVLTENELMCIDGGIAFETIASAIAIGWGAYQIGEAAGKTVYYLTHPRR